MCGIVGILGKDDVAPRLVEALKRLEYRGYDSAGIATVENGVLGRLRAEGKLANLDCALGNRPLTGRTGIGHTRWATHGAPNETNAHPHATDRVAVVHNGIIENFQTLRAELESRGRVFSSDTDTEVVAHLITANLEDGMSPSEAGQAAFRRLEGAFALGIIFAGEEDLMLGARRGSPLAVGLGEGEMYLGSDALALAPMTDRIIYLEEDDSVLLTRESAIVRDAEGRVVNRPVRPTSRAATVVDKGNYRHFMMKEIAEQPTVIGETLNSYFHPQSRRIRLPNLPFALEGIDRVTIVACGTAYYAGMVAKYWLEQVARVSVEIDIASEFRYREAAMPEGGLTIVISQSGETADTLAALRYAKREGQHVAGVVNVPDSTIAREVHAVLPTHAGPEIGVASTKAFTCQLTVLASFAIALACARGAIDHATEARLSQAIVEVPSRAADVLAADAEIERIAQTLAQARNALYLGRGLSYPIALEGALKLKEISYVHAEGYAAGEMKHGPIALIDDEMPVVVVAPRDSVFPKTISNMQETVARGGRVILISDKEGIAEAGRLAREAVELPAVDPFVSPILYALPVQLLAYYAAVAKGTDVDQPRNLAKSVTVE